MLTFSISDLSRKSGAIIANALQGPVSINQRGKPHLIMLSVEQYDALIHAADNRMAGATADMSEDMASCIGSAIDNYLLDTAPAP